MSKTVAIIDLDTPIFKAAVSHQTDKVKVTHTKTGIQKEFKNKTEFKDLLKSKDKLIKLPEYTIEAFVESVQPLHFAIKALKNNIDSINDALWTDEVIYVMSGKNNFRDDLPLPTKYKSNRPQIRPVLLKEIQKFAWKHYNAVVANGKEADDLQIYLGYEELSKGNTPVVVAVDKDAKAYSGLSLYNPDKPQLGTLVIPDVGEVYLDSKGEIRALGMMQYGVQCLLGDSCDGFRPTDLCKVKFGNVSAYKALKDCKTEKEILEVVVGFYKKWYPVEFEYTCWQGKVHSSNWLGMLQLYHRCCRMQETENDPLDVKEFFKSYGVSLD